jgi:hypothetical protein
VHLFNLTVTIRDKLRRSLGGADRAGAASSARNGCNRHSGHGIAWRIERRGRISMSRILQPWRIAVPIGAGIPAHLNHMFIFGDSFRPDVRIRLFFRVQNHCEVNPSITARYR